MLRKKQKMNKMHEAMIRKYAEREKATEVNFPPPPLGCVKEEPLAISPSQPSLESDDNSLLSDSVVDVTIKQEVFEYDRQCEPLEDLPEKTPPNPTASKRKLDLLSTSYVIFDKTNLLQWVRDIARCECGNKMTVKEDTHKPKVIGRGGGVGMAETYIAVCHQCNISKRVCTSNGGARTVNTCSETNHYDVHYRLVQASLRARNGYSVVRELSSALNMPLITEKTFYKFAKRIKRTEEEAASIAAEQLRECSRLSRKNVYLPAAIAEALTGTAQGITADMKTPSKDAINSSLKQAPVEDINILHQQEVMPSISADKKTPSKDVIDIEGKSSSGYEAPSEDINIFHQKEVMPKTAARDNSQGAESTSSSQETVTFVSSDMNEKIPLKSLPETSEENIFFNGLAKNVYTIREKMSEILEELRKNTQEKKCLTTEDPSELDWTVLCHMASKNSYEQSKTSYSEVFEVLRLPAKTISQLLDLHRSIEEESEGGKTRYLALKHALMKMTPDHRNQTSEVDYTIKDILRSVLEGIANLEIWQFMTVTKTASPNEKPPMDKTLRLLYDLILSVGASKTGRDTRSIKGALSKVMKSLPALKASKRYIERRGTDLNEDLKKLYEEYKAAVNEEQHILSDSRGENQTSSSPGTSVKKTTQDEEQIISSRAKRKVRYVRKKPLHSGYSSEDSPAEQSGSDYTYDDY